MQREEVQTGIGRLKVIQDKYGFICNKCCFHCSMAKGKTCPKCGKDGHFAAVRKSKPQSLTVSSLQNESSSDEEHCFTTNSPLAKTTFSLNDALPMKFVMAVVVGFCLCK